MESNYQMQFIAISKTPFGGELSPDRRYSQRILSPALWGEGSDTESRHVEPYKW